MSEDIGRVPDGTGLSSLRDEAASASPPKASIPSREAIAAAIKKTEYKYFGDYEMTDDQFDAVDTLVECAQAIDRVQVALRRRSVPTMDAVWSAAFNAALDMVGQALNHTHEVARDCKWCNDGCGWYTSHSGGFARWVPCDHCNYDGTAKRDPRAQPPTKEPTP